MRCTSYLQDTYETDEGGDRFGGEIAGKEAPKECNTFATPRIKRSFPLGFLFCTLQGAPKGIELDSEEEVERRTGERDEESDRSSWTAAAEELGAGPSREGKDGPRHSRHLYFVEGEDVGVGCPLLQVAVAVVVVYTWDAYDSGSKGQFAF